MVDLAPNEHPFSPHAPCGLFFARDLSKAKKEASHGGLASFLPISSADRRHHRLGHRLGHHLGRARHHGLHRRHRPVA